MKPPKEDRSPYIAQRDKVKKELKLRDKIPWTEKQQRFFEVALDKSTRIMFVRGPAGTSKTCCAVFAALKLLNEKRLSDIIYIRSAVESADKSLGYLPGDVDDKLSFYNLPFAEKLDEFLTKEDITYLQKDERITMYPVNFSRGMNWNAKSIIVDEAQNMSRKELITVLTRLGEYSRCFVLADPLQSDLPISKSGAFEEMYQLFDNEESKNMGIHVFEFTEEDIVRSKLVRFLVSKFDKLKPTNKESH